MNVTQRGVIALLKSAITQKAETLPEQFDIEKAYPVLRRHCVTALGYSGAINCQIPPSLPVIQKLKQDYVASLIRSSNQLAEINRLFAAFENNKIAYMPLKGCNMKALYPSHELRGMGDADILIRKDQYPDIKLIMEDLNFQMLGEGDKVISWSKKNLEAELHKQLVPNKQEKYYNYYGSGWSKASVKQGCCHEMSKEDELIFDFVHFVMHYSGSGIGCRHVVDLWVYLRSFPDLDDAYIKKELKGLDLYEFYCNMRRVISAWFEGGIWDDKVELITNVIFANGNWGNAKNYMLSEVIRFQDAKASSVKRKIKWFWDLIFLPFAQMRYRYPVLKRCSILLPICWIVRWLDILFRRSGNIVKSYKRFIHTTAAEIENHEQSLAYVGLRFEK